MPPLALPPRPSLEHLRKQAKDLLKAYRAAHPRALARFRQSQPRLAGASDDHLERLSISLRDAQRVVAAEYGFASWPHMLREVHLKEMIDMLEVTVDRVAVVPESQQHVLLLKNDEVSRCLPIWIGATEGQSIALKLEGKEMPRPMTHDLMDSMIGDLGASVARVVVSELKGDTFLARVVLRRNGTTVERDCRPSDAIALAVRNGAAIFVEDDVLERAGVDYDPETGLSESTAADWLKRTTEERASYIKEEPADLLDRARTHAQCSGRPEVEPADLLLVLIDDADGPGASVLSRLGLDLAEASAKLREQSGNGEATAEAVPGLSEAAQRVLRLARAEAHMLFHGRFGAEHVVLGLLLADDAVASRTLKDGGVEIEAARAAATDVASEQAASEG